jgi:hypothetical protein
MMSHRQRGLVCCNVIGCAFLILASCSSGSNGGGSSGGTNAGGTNAGGTSGSGGTTSIVSSSSGGKQAGGTTSSGGNAGGTAGQTATSGGHGGTSALGGTTSSGGNAGGTAGQTATSGGHGGTSALGGTTSSGGNAGGTAGQTAGAGGSQAGGSSTPSGGAGGTGQTAPQYPPPFPRPGTTQLFENDAIAVWDVSWLKQEYPMHTHLYDLFGVSYVEGDRVITPPGSLTTTKAWVFQENVAGSTHVEEGASEPPMRAVLMEVKSAAPRIDVVETPDGLRQVAGAPAGENRRTCAGAIAPGSAAPSHRHDRDAVELVFTAANPATTPTVAFVPEGTVHAGPTPEPGGRVYIFEIK